LTFPAGVKESAARVVCQGSARDFAADEARVCALTGVRVETWNLDEQTALEEQAS